MYGAYHHITVVGKEGAPRDHVYDVVGSLCENNDKFAVQRPLPRIEPGDMVVLHDTGAHGRSMGYNYNGKLRSAEVLLRPDGSFRLIRRRETPADYFATLDFPPLREAPIILPHRPTLPAKPGMILLSSLEPAPGSCRSPGQFPTGCGARNSAEYDGALPFSESFSSIACTVGLAWNRAVASSPACRPGSGCHPPPPVR